MLDFQNLNDLLPHNRCGLVKTKNPNAEQSVLLNIFYWFICSSAPILVMFKINKTKYFVLTRADESIICWVSCRFKGRSEFSANHSIPGLLLLVKNKTDLISYWIEYWNIDCYLLMTSALPLILRSICKIQESTDNNLSSFKEITGQYISSFMN